MKKKLFLVLLFISMIFLFVSCEFFLGVEWTFDNWTSYNITISVEGGYPSTVYLSAWGKETSTVYGDTINYTYNYADLVYPYRVPGENKIKFYMYE